MPRGFAGYRMGTGRYGFRNLARSLAKRARRRAPVRRVFRNLLTSACSRPLIAKQCYMETAIVGAGYGAASNDAYSFVLSSIPDYQAFQQLFDQYKILRIDVTLEPCFSSNDTNASQTTLVPLVNQMSPMVNRYYRIVKDYDDDTPLTNETDYFQYDSLMNVPVYTNKTFTFKIYPKMKLQSAGNNDVSVKPQWIDFDNVNLVHYGFKIYIPPTNTLNGYIQTNLRVTMYFKCRNRQ